MTKAACPSEASLLSFADDDLPPEEAEQVRAHLPACARCRDDVAALSQLVADMRAPMLVALDPKQHVRAVMSAVEAADARPQLRSRGAPRMAALALAASAVLSVGYLGLRERTSIPHWQARGGGVATIARDVGVQVYASETPLRPLQPGAAFRSDAPLTAGFRNLGARPVSLLLFAIDAHQTVHWISPSYTRVQDDPLATELLPTVHERLLPTSVVFDDVAPGALRVIAVISAEPTHVSDIESLAVTGLDPRDITRRLPKAEVRETVIQVTNATGAVRP